MSCAWRSTTPPRCHSKRPADGGSPARSIEIGASALPQVGTQAAAREFRVKVRLSGDIAMLRPGLTCDAEILVAERANVLTVPLQAVVQRGGDTGVFVVENEVVTFRALTTGIIGGLQIEVDGVAEGTTIVSGPFQALRELVDGARVTTARGHPLVRGRPGTLVGAW